MFTQQDLQQIREHGLTPELAETQLENFRRGFPFLNVVRAASPGDGVLMVTPAEADASARLWALPAHSGRNFHSNAALPLSGHYQGWVRLRLGNLLSGSTRV